MLNILIAYVLDLLIGDPRFLYHPVRIIGNMINFLESLLLKEQESNPKKKFAGLLLLVLVASSAYIIPLVILQSAEKLSPLLKNCLEIIMIYQIFATKSLDTETRKVYKALRDKNIKMAKKWISYLVSRDTDLMDEEDIIKASIETISENIGDGVIAPMLFIAIGGAPLGWFYKAVNTLDSMVGYKNEKYDAYGFFSAKFDDLLNYIPARVSAVLMVLSAFLLGLDGKNAYKMLIRDRRNHSSPNSAYPESAAAGALRIQLGGKASYFGKVSIKPTMGDALKKIDNGDLNKMRRLLYTTSLFGLLLMQIIMVIK